MDRAHWSLCQNAWRCDCMVVRQRRQDLPFENTKKHNEIVALLFVCDPLRDFWSIEEKNYLVCDHCKLKKLTPKATLTDKHFVVKLECMCKTIMRLILHSSQSQTESAFTFLHNETQFNCQWLNNFHTKLKVVVDVVDFDF